MSHTSQVVAAPPPPARSARASLLAHSLPWAPAAVLLGFLYYPIVKALVSDWWTDPNFSHGFFVPLFAGYVLWMRREELRRVAIRPANSGLVILLIGLATLVVGTLGSELFLSRSSLVIVIAGVVIYCRGWRFFRVMLFPWAVLFLMIPIPTIIFNQITFPLQLLASQLASWVLPLFRVPVLREGNIINLPAMPLEVAEACSGIRSLVSLGTLAVIYGYFLEKRIYVRVLLIASALPIAIAANAVRIVGTGLAVQYWDPQRAEGFFHEFTGWVIFLASLCLLLTFHGFLRLLLPGRRSNQ